MLYNNCHILFYSKRFKERIHYVKYAWYFPRAFDNSGFKCKIICHFKISAIAGLETEWGIISNGVNPGAEFNATTGFMLAHVAMPDKTEAKYESGLLRIFAPMKDWEHKVNVMVQ